MHRVQGNTRWCVFKSIKVSLSMSVLSVFLLQPWKKHMPKVVESLNYWLRPCVFVHAICLFFKLQIHPQCCPSTPSVEHTTVCHISETVLARLFFLKKISLLISLCVRPSVCLPVLTCRKTSSRFPILPKLGTKITLIQTKIQAKELESYDQRVPRYRDSKKPK